MCATVRTLLVLSIVSLLATAWEVEAQDSPTQKVDPQSSSVSVSQAQAEAKQNPDDRFVLQPGDDPNNHLLLPFLKHIATDQAQFWTEPTRFRVKDLKWAVPLIGVTAGFIASDQWWSKQVPDSSSQLTRSLHISDYSVYSLLGIGGGAFLLGQIKHDDHMSEAGLLSGEAAINSTGVTYLLKEITQRQRPTEGNGNGNFFTGGASFPSEHSAIAWSIASVMAHEYPGSLTQIAAYGLASAVTLTRVTARQHFPSDVIVGSALGWYFGRQTYRAHHDPKVGGGPWGAWSDAEPETPTRNPSYMASPYVPVDSWIYPALERLIALGYIKSNIIGIRPWTRLACAKLLNEALDRVPQDGNENADADKLFVVLQKEFATESDRLDGAPNVGASLDSVYTRSTGISGTPLDDGFHFGQTIINDYGRPYWTGYNNVSGVAGQAEAGPIAFYVRGEYQHAPAVPSESSQTLQATALVDDTPVIGDSIPGIDRFRLLDATVSLKTGNVQFTFGQQSLWLGPTTGGSFLMSNNAEPLPMFRIDSVSPYEIPFVSRILGPVRSEFFLGRLSGQTWSNTGVLYGPGLPSQPYVHGTKLSFQPTPDLEIGIGLTVQFGGTGNPFTWHNFLRSFFSHKADINQNPAKRLSEIDLSYRVPGLRNWLSVYVDSMVIDEYSPIVSNRPAINPGIYMPRLPKIPKMELRLEGVTTDLNVPSHFGPGAFYWDGRYRSGYTNNGNLMGSWIGRRGRGEQCWLTYSFSPGNQLELNYRNNNVDKGFIGGGHMQDIGVRSSVELNSTITLSGFIQYETWQFPVLASGRNTDVTSSIQLEYHPGWIVKKHSR